MPMPLALYNLSERCNWVAMHAAASGATILWLKHMCGLSGAGLTVQQRTTEEDGTIALQSLHHVMALSGYHADMIARINLARFPGANARLPCGFCGIEATAEERHYYPKGYAKLQRHSLLLRPPRDVLANDEALWISDR